MKLLVCGGRDFNDKRKLFYCLDKLNETTVISCILNGYAKGADMLSVEWAISRQVRCVVFPAKWKTYGKAAGAIRNSLMLKAGQPDALMAFPGGKGTQDMIKKSQKYGLLLFEIDPLFEVPENYNIEEKDASKNIEN